MITVAVVVDEFMFWVIVVDFVVIVQQSVIVGPVILVQVWFPVRFRLEPEYFHFVGIHDGGRFDIFVEKKLSAYNPVRRWSQVYVNDASGRIVRKKSFRAEIKNTIFYWYYNHSRTA